MLTSRFANAFAEGAARYPIFRRLRFAARTDIESLFDRVALNSTWHAERVDSGCMILDADGLYVTAYGGRKSDYCSCDFSIWASGTLRAEQAKETILAEVAGTRITEPMFTIKWTFLNSHGELESASIEELADDVLHDRAYPEIADGVESFINRYLDAPETVLVIQGPPGTGKTRLIRAILGHLSRRKGSDARALYTGDKRALETDNIYFKFITGWDDAFVVEDADHLLKPRSQGNDHLHRFLAIADGVVRAQRRKIIFSTNLPNVGDLDDALIRPGRCFARVQTRTLTESEAQRLLADLSPPGGEALNRALHALVHAGAHNHVLAEIYQATRRCYLTALTSSFRADCSC